MARLPSFVTRAEGKRGVTYEARINVVLPDGRRLQPKCRFKTTPRTTPRGARRMRWSAVDLDAELPTIAVRATRVSTAEGIITQDDAKTISSRRTLPVPPHLLPILRRARHEQVHAKVRLGVRWGAATTGTCGAMTSGRRCLRGR